MFKAVYKNYKSGKYYTFEKEGENTKFVPVFVDDGQITKENTKVDSKGKAYNILDVEPFKTKNGFDAYRTIRKTSK